MSIFVAGTDTEVGKTVTSSLLMARYGRQIDIGYWKPIATGAVDDRDVDSVVRLAGPFGTVHSESYLFEPPVSPHLAARLARKAIDPIRVIRDFKMLRREHPDRQFIVEGIGGVLVPVTERGDLMIDITKRLRMPCVVVARSTLGTINHTLLTLEALRRRKIDIAGVIMNGPKNRENRRAIERFGNTVVLGEVEKLTRLNKPSVAKAARRIDRRGILKQFLL